MTTGVHQTADSLETPVGDGGRSVSVRSLRAGMRLSQSIYEESGVLLLASGTEVSPRFLKLLSDRKVTNVVLQSPGTDQVTRLLDSVLQDLGSSGPIGKPGANLSPDELAKEATAGLEKHATAGDDIADVGRTLSRGKTVSMEEVGGVVHAFADMITLDTDLLSTIVAIQQSKAEYLFDHCVNTAALSMTMGSQLGLTEEQLTELGTGALLADVGMLRVPQEIRLSAKPLTAGERAELERHPCYTFDYLTRMRGLPTAAQMVGYQIHERMDARGYPRGRSGLFINEYAKIAAVADTYAALTHARPHRPAFQPYLAAKTILVDCSQGKFDPAVVRVFLDTIGLFPVRSYVALSDGTRAVVLRTNPGLHTKPVVRKLDDAGEPTGDVLDLAQSTDTTVAAAVDADAIVGNQQECAASIGRS